MSEQTNASGAQVPCISLLAEIDRIIEEHPTSGDHAEDGRYCLHDRMAALYALAEKYDLIPKANAALTGGEAVPSNGAVGDSE